MKSNELGKKREIPVPMSSHQAFSFKDICPIWSFKLESGFDDQDVETLAHDSKFCIVGEAWGYSGRQTGYYVAPLIPFVGCWECIRLGREMGKIAKVRGPSAAPFYLRPTIDYFVRHWNLNHSEITGKSRCLVNWRKWMCSLHFNSNKM